MDDDAPPSIEELRTAPIFPAFAAAFRRILQELAGWSTERADERLERYIQNSGFRAWFGHDSPAHFAAHELIPADATEPARIASRICGAIEREGGADDPWFPNEDPNYDWQAARERVAAILREYQADSN
jgi:hypothetical protein